MELPERHQRPFSESSFYSTRTGNWAHNAELKLYNYEEALRADPAVAQWILFAQNATLCLHPYILEDWPELPKVPGPHADAGGEVLEGIVAHGCTSPCDAKISGWAEGQVSASWVRPGPAGIVSSVILILRQIMAVCGKSKT
jgi:hypothetical protein